MTVRLSLVAALLLLPPMARAEDRALPPMTTQVQGNRVWLDVTAWPSGGANIFTFGLNGQLQVQKYVVLHVEIPAAVGQISGEPAPHAAAGNVVAGVRVIGAAGPAVVMWGGLSVAVPTLYSVAPTNDGVASSSIAALAASSREGFDVDRFYPENVFVRGDFGFEVRFARILRYRFDLAGLVGTPVGADAVGLVPGLQSSSEFQGEFANHLCLGARLQASLFTISLAGGPFIGYEPPGSGFLFRVDGLVGSQPFLFRVSVDGVFWSASLRAGYKF